MKPRTYKQKQQALKIIAKMIERCRICKKGKIGKAVPGEGNADADVVFIGEAPGKTEAATGRPFVGRSGKLLRGLIAGAGLKDDRVFITSPVKYLPEYVTPTPADIAHGRKHLMEQLDIIKPKVAVLLGATAVRAVFGRNNSHPRQACPVKGEEKADNGLSKRRENSVGASASVPLPRREGAGEGAQPFQISKIHGTVIRQNGITYLITYHPAAPLYSPKLREKMKKDFRKLKRIASAIRKQI
jgi:DNA polymerase